ncbi:MAG TPA: D-hexose-6-phosphate mutarotase [Tepidisphaeraceae bacterium]|nr:D-hexose-6-phosphate mutarotase [Tepidisphaeraceae bacterium]
MSAEALHKITLTNPDSEAQLYPYGSHVSSWKPKGQKDVLFLSKSSLFTPGKAIRGGVPIIFPWFGPRQGHPESPAHGFARTTMWNVAGCDNRPNGSCAMSLELTSSDATRAIWPNDFLLRFTIAAEKKLTLSLSVTNTGRAPFTFEEAMHTYLAIGDIRQTTITGLAGVQYIDKVDKFTRKTPGPEPIVISGETDRVYLNTRSTCVVDDGAWKRKISVAKENSNATVVWNPWIEKAKAFADFGDDEWPEMVCIETCNVGENSVTLEPGKSHVMTAIVSLG